MPWTSYELAVADDLSLSDAEVAARTGRPVEGVRRQRWRRADPERAEELAKAYYAENRDRILGRSMLYQRVNRDRIRTEAHLAAVEEREAAARHGKPFEPWEDRLILADNVAPRELAGRLGRTVSAVWQRRRKLRSRQAQEAPNHVGGDQDSDDEERPTAAQFAQPPCRWGRAWCSASV